MNEQILKLYKQAQEFAYKNISKESWNTDNFYAVVSGKFAELIVRARTIMIVKECAQYLKETDYSDLDSPNEALYLAADDLLKLFGVEE